MATELLAVLKDARARLCCRWRPTDSARFPSLDAVRQWLQTDRATLMADVAELSLTDGPEAGLEAADLLVTVLLAFRLADDAVTVAQACAAACDRAAPVTQGLARLLVGRTLAASPSARTQAVPVLLMALADFTEHDETAMAARTSFVLADALLALGAAEKALIHVDQAAEGFRRVGDQVGEAQAVGLHARVLKACGAVSESVDAGWEAAGRFEALAAPRCAASVLHRTGQTLLTTLGAPEAAAEALRPCAQLRAGLRDHRGEAAALRLLGAALHAGGDPKRASGVLRRAADAARAAGDAAELAACRRQLASALTAAGWHRDAAILARSAADHFAAAGDPRAEGRALTVLALAQAGTGHHPSAISTAQRAVGLLASTGARSDTATAYMMLGTLSVDLGRYTGGVSALREALRLFLAEGDAGHAEQVRESLAKAELERPGRTVQSGRAGRAARRGRTARPVAGN